ncbi:hypothetical protein [Nocardia cyriacigeorgica]|uniref:hypothetical protein n=1 Tax=Nocardia cyriacigeorgica TaxID=135487 RepID=UPI0024573302|nr:hypothetical protein [Nocardia cyriacigeorgica]
MLRRLTIIAAVLVGGVGCQQQSTSPSVDQIWFTPAVSEAEVSDVFHRIRNVDTCALIPRSALEEQGKVEYVRVGGQTINGCRARFDADGSAVEATWSLVWAPQASAIEETRKVGDVKIEVLSPEDLGSTAEPKNCWTTAEFPSMAQIFLDIEAPSPVDTCAIGNALIDTAIEQLPTSPAFGASPDAVRTVLTGADPCEALPKLGATPLPVHDYQVAQVCRFGSADAPTAIEYAYQADDEINRDETITIDGRPVHVGRAGDGQFIGYTFAVGQELPGGALPIITVLGKNKQEVERTRDQLMTMYPLP